MQHIKNYIEKIIKEKNIEETIWLTHGRNVWMNEFDDWMNEQNVQNT